MKNDDRLVLTRWVVRMTGDTWLAPEKHHPGKFVLARSEATLFETKGAAHRAMGRAREFGFKFGMALERIDFAEVKA